MQEIAITNGIILTMDDQRRVLEDGYVLISGDQIIELGLMAKFRKSGDIKIIDAKGKLVLPGLINVHSHVADILLRGGLSQDRSLYDWLLNVLYPGMNACTSSDIEIGTTLYLVEAIRSGITTVVDNEDFPSLQNHRIMLNLFNKAGMRVIFGRMFSDMPPPLELESHYRDIQSKSPLVHHVNDYLIQDTHRAISETETLIRESNTLPSGLVNVWPSPFNPAWCTREGLLASLELANKYNTGITIHLAETRVESKPFGMSSTEYLDSIHFLSSKLLAAHCVWSNEKDIALMKRNDVKVAHQPSANMYLASGFAPIPAMLRAGVTVGLGSDDANDNDSVNMFVEMRAAALVHKAVTLDSSSVTAEQALEMATINGAKALGMHTRMGSIEVGKKADLIIMNLGMPHLRPFHHIPSVLAYQVRGHEVETVIVNGKIIMHNHQISWMSTESEEALLDGAQKASIAIRERANLELPQKYRVNQLKRA